MPADPLQRATKFVPQRDGPPLDSGAMVIVAGLGLLGAALLVAAVRPAPGPRRRSTAKAATRVRQASGLLAASVLVDSAFEHFRGNYANPAMYVAPTTAAVTLAASVAGPGRRGVRAGGLAGGALVGLAGLGFHAYNILKRPGGLSWNNLFYAAPFGAPGALSLAGLLGLGGVGLEWMGERGTTRRRRRAAGRVLGAATAGGLLATVTEVGLLHFRGAFQNPFMYAPVTLPPVAAVALAAAVADPTPRRLGWARGLLRATAALGLVGTGFHAWGISRSMGGWRNWSQNLFAGPPLPAPPSFTGLALAGLGALRLLDRRPAVEDRDD